MKKLIAITALAFLCQFFNVSQAQTSKYLMGIQHFDPLPADSIFHGVTVNFIADSEKVYLNELGVTMVYMADNISGQVEGETGTDTMMINWAKGNGGYPKVSSATPYYTGSGPDTTELFKDWFIGGINWGVYPNGYSVVYDIYGYVNRALTLDKWTLRRPRNYGIGGTLESNFIDTTRMLISRFKYGFDHSTPSGFGLLYLGDEEHEWMWEDPKYITPAPQWNYMRYSLRDSAEANASRWRRGMGFIAKAAKDSGLSAQSFYEDESAFLIGYGGNRLYDTITTETYLSYYSGADGVPDTLARLSTYFKDMAFTDYNCEQWYPFNQNTSDSNSIRDQQELGVDSHNWRAVAAGIAQARTDQRAWHRAHPTASADTNPISYTNLAVLLQACHAQDHSDSVNNTGRRPPTQLEMQDIVNLGFACGMRLPLWYVYDGWPSDSEEVGVRSLAVNSGTSPATKHPMFWNIYNQVQYVDDSVINIFGPLMDTLEYYDGLTTKLGTMSSPYTGGDRRPFGGDYSNGWGIKGHEYLDSLIAKDVAGHIDALAQHSTDSNATYVDIGFFRPQRSGKTIKDTDFIDTTREYMYVLNRRVDSVSTTNVGNRYITLDLDRATRPLWKRQPYLHVHDMVGGWDTLLYWRSDTASFTTYYTRAQGKLYSFTPAGIDTSIIDDEGVSYNNGVHSVKHTDTITRIVYIRHDSCFARRINVLNDSMYAEVLLARGGSQTLTCTGASGLHGWINMNPTIARHRGGVNEDMIVWECIDTLSNQPLGGPNIAPHILCAVLDDNDNLLTSSTISCPVPVKGIDITGLAPVVTNTLSFLATPVICGTDSGWVIAWADSAQGIYWTAIGGKGGVYYPYSGSYPLLSAPKGKFPAMFPSVAWGTDQVGGGGGFQPMPQIVWQQPDSVGMTQIWHNTLELTHWSSQSPTLLQTIDATEDVSRPWNADPWLCENTMPCIAIDAIDSVRVGPPAATILNNSYIVWHALILNDSMNPNRIRYRQRMAVIVGLPTPGLHGYYANAVTYSSGARGFLEPNVFVAPVDTNKASLLLVWYSTLSTMHAYIPGQTVLHSFPNGMFGKHPTYSYALWEDTIPLVLFQTKDSLYRAALAQHSDYDPSNTQALQQTRQVNGVAVEGKPGTYFSCAECCALTGIEIAIGGNTGSPVGITPVHLPVIISTQFTGNGVYENGAVQSNYLRLQVGTPLKFDRQLIAKDTQMLTGLLSTGNHPQALIELVDSATQSVLAVLDSFTVAHPHDTVDHEGTLSFSPAAADTGKAVFVRARILADSNVALWSVTSDVQFETGDTLGGGLMKEISKQPNAVTPSGDNILALDAYPNPFNPKTSITFTVPVEDANDITDVRVYDLMGNDVTMLVHDIKPAGKYAVAFDGSRLPSGRYMVAVKTANHAQTKLIMLER